jgi:hypothetical protein
VVFVDVKGVVEFSHVECVQIVIFICNGKVEGFHGIPGDGVGAELKSSKKKKRSTIRPYPKCITSDLVSYRQNNLRQRLTGSHII